MARNEPSMRILNRDIKEYKRLRTNYRSKLWRIRRATNFSLPAEQIDKELGLSFPSLNEFKEGAFETRKQFNQFKKEVKEVTSRTFQPLQITENKSGMRYPKIVNQIGTTQSKKAQQKVDQQRDRLSKLPLFLDGEERGTVADSQLALTDAEKYGIYKSPDFDIDDYINPKSVEKRIDRDILRQQDEYYTEKKETMLDHFMSIFQGKGDTAENIIRLLEQMDPDDFYELYLMFPDEVNFEDWDSDTAEHQTGDTNQWYGRLEQILSPFADGDIDTSLKYIG